MEDCSFYAFNIYLLIIKFSPRANVEATTIHNQ